ncbi:MAG: DUF3592 domain-containing protein [Candidatus Promineifilaceae bacterium]|nr:DUF3592 domain-containing protein [Candidatus Promineifilaceae bacterium]
MNDGFAALFLLGIIGIIVYHIKRSQKANDSLRWPSTSGRIVSAGTKAVPAGGSRNYGAMVRVPDIRYKYSVDGVEYSGEQLSYGAGTGSTESVLARYQPESTVKVYYDPADPSEAVLVPGPGTSNYLAIVWTVFMAIVFVIAWIGGILP